MCDYQGYEFGAGGYPDSVCIEGKLYDADNCDNDGNLYEPMLHIPCPICKPNDAVKYWFDHNKECEDYEGDDHALKTAIALVNDIRANRDVSPVEYASGE